MVEPTSKKVLLLGAGKLISLLELITKA